MTSTRSLIATISAIAAIGFGVVAVVYWAFFSAAPLSLTNLDWPTKILVVAAILAFSVYLLAAPETIGRAASRRSNRLAANALVAAVVAIAITIVINVIIGTLPVVRADVTAGKTFTLSDQTIKVLQNLKEPVNAVAFYSDSQPSGTSRQQIEDELRAYQTYSTKFKYEFVDPYQSPARANEYGVTRLGSVVFDNGKKREIATGITEADFTGALVRLEQTGTRTVAFLTGHGERDPNGSDQNGYSSMKDALTKDNYNVITWSLITSPTLTVQDATVLVIAEPQRPLTSKEVSTIQGYLDAGGRMMMLLDPQMPANALGPAADLLKKYSVEPVQGGIVDLQKSYSPQEPSVVVVNTYPDSDVTRDLNRDQLATLFPLSMMIKPPTSTLSTYDITSIVQSSTGAQASWLETDLTSLGNGTQKYDAGKDIAGPCTIGLTIATHEDTSATPTASTTTTNTVKTRIVVFGDADFPSNQLLSSQLPIANLDLFANSVSWLAGANDLVSIRPKAPDAPRTVALTTNQQQVLFGSTVCGLPLLVLLLGAFIWWRRR